MTQNWPKVTEALAPVHPMTAPAADSDQSKTTPCQVDLTVSNETHQGKPPRVTRSEQARMLRYRHQDGMTYEAIATTLKRSIQTVHAYLSPLESTVDEARAKLAAASGQAVDDFVLASKVAATQGNHKAAKDLLAAAGAIVDRPETAIAVQVNIPQGGESRSDNRMPKELETLSD